MIKKEFHKAYTIFKISLGSQLVYRFSFFTRLCFVFLTLGSYYLFWQALFEYTDTIASYTFKEMFSYLIVANVAYSFMHADGVMISDQIREGELNHYLLRPYGFIASQFCKLLGNRALFFLSNFLPLIVVFTALVHFDLVHLQLDPLRIIFFILTILSGLVIHFFIDVLIGLCAFWFESSDFLFIVKEICFWMLAGLWFPLGFLPSPLRETLELLPFKYLGFVPAEILTSAEGVSYSECFLLLSWIVILAFLVNFVWIKGVKKYEAYGW